MALRDADQTPLLVLRLWRRLDGGDASCRRLRPGTEHERLVAFLYRKHAIGSALSARPQSFRSSAHRFAFHFRLSFWADAVRSGPHRQLSRRFSIRWKRRPEECIYERIAPTLSRNFRHVRVLMDRSDLDSEFADRASRSADGRGRNRYLSGAAIGNGGARPSHLCGEWLRLLSQPTGARRLCGSDIERKWGERRSAPRDYIFDRPVLLGKMRVGSGSGEHRKTRARDGQSCAATGAATTSLRLARRPLRHFACGIADASGVAVSSPATSPAPASPNSERTRRASCAAIQRHRRATVFA